MPRVRFVDSSVLLNVLNVPGKNSDHAQITSEFKASVQANDLLVIPIAAIIEVGNHIAQLPDGGLRRKLGNTFAGFIRSGVARKAPWVVSGASWDADFLGRLIDGHGTVSGMADLCMRGIGAGDASILHEMRRYRGRSDVPSGLAVTIWTLDAALAAHQ